MPLLFYIFTRSYSELLLETCREVRQRTETGHVCNLRDVVQTTAILQQRCLLLLRTSAAMPTTWQTVWTGTGNYLALDIYSADGYLHEGTYTACAAGGQIAEGEFGIGWDPGDLWGIGMVFENWGTCWWSVSGGAAVAEAKVLDGTLTVAVDGETYTITLESSAVNARYVGVLTL